MEQKNILGCLLGGAIGDALGMPFEELPLSMRKELYEDKKITDFMPGLPYKLRQREIPAGSVTDDTEMVLVTAESIINNNAIVVNDIANSLLKWIKRDYTWLRGTAQDRNIGNTTRKALENYARGISCEECGINSGGCGASIRISPIALCCFNDYDLMCRSVFSVARITHKNLSKPLAEEGALLVAASIHYLLRGGRPINLVDFLTGIVITNEFKDQLAKIKDGLQESLTINMAADRIGTGGSNYLATEVVSLAIFIFLKYHKSFEDTVIEAININSPAGVDTDSIASIAGALSGCYLGVDKIPLRWRQKVEYKEQIESLSQDLFKIISLSNGGVEFKEV